MALTPYLLDRIFDDMLRPTYHDSLVPINRNLGMGVSLTDFIRDFSVPLRSGYLRPWRYLNMQDSGLSNVINDKDNFKVNLDVQQFHPEELKVEVTDKYLVVEGKHEERSDEHGYVSRQFTRRYHLPDNVDQKKITSTLSSDGVLQLCAPKKSTPERASIPIKQTNKPAVKAKPSEETKKGGEKMET